MLGQMSKDGKHFADLIKNGGSVEAGCKMVAELLVIIWEAGCQVGADWRQGVR